MNLIGSAHAEVRQRMEQRRGIGERTFKNMLSSQAMCFNVFAPLRADGHLATEVLMPFLPGVTAITSIEFEYTPAEHIFRDQSGLAGVDCDLLVEAQGPGGKVIVAMETKFVETEFSRCGFRRSAIRPDGRARDHCRDDVRVARERSACLYQSAKSYRYWTESDELGTLRPDAVGEVGCPFAGPEWQLWVNHTLAHAEAKARGASRAIFVVCAPASNHGLLHGGILESFRRRIRDPSTIVFTDVDDLLERIRSGASGRPQLGAWSAALEARYAKI